MHPPTPTLNPTDEEKDHHPTVSSMRALANPQWIQLPAAHQAAATGAAPAKATESPWLFWNHAAKTLKEAEACSTHRQGPDLPHLSECAPPVRRTGAAASGPK